eukprot:gene28861-35847_t
MYKDEYPILAQRNDNLQLTVKTLKAGLHEETTRLNNSHGTSAELLRWLEVSTECIRSMRKDYALECSQCKNTRPAELCNTNRL